MGLLGDMVNAFDVPRKSKGSTYALLIFLGLLGGHQFYLKKYLRGILYIAAFIGLMSSWIMLMVPLAYICAAVLVIFFVLDLFTLGRQVDKWNNANAGNALLKTAGQVAGNVLSIPLDNAIQEYNGIVENFRDAVERFDEKKSAVESLLYNLQKARKEVLQIIPRMQKIIDKIPKEEKELVTDKLGEAGDFSTDIVKQLYYDADELSASLEQAIETASQELTATFEGARELTQMFESNAGKFAAATAATVIQGLVTISEQQKKIVALKQGREEILRKQHEIETRIRQLEATEKRAGEILKVIEGEMPGFNHIYNNFCSVVFPDGILELKEVKSLTLEEQKLLMDLVVAVRKIIAAGSQEIN